MDCHSKVDVSFSNTSNSNRNRPRMKQKKTGIPKYSSKKKIKWKAFKTEFGFSHELSENSVQLNLPLRTVSEANTFEHWTQAYKRHMHQKMLVTVALKPLKCYIKLPCHIKLIRYAPNSLDEFENLPMSFKYIVDACCAIITGDSRPGRVCHRGVS